MQPNSDTDRFGGEGSHDDDFDLSFQTKLDVQSASENLLREFDLGPEPESNVEAHGSSIYENFLNQRWRDLASGGSITGFPLPSDVGASLPSPGQSLYGGLLSSPIEKLVLPEINEQIYGFHLRKELGRGSFARVFLANQGGLADREVVLKISRIEGREAQTLAQLQHTHVVPIYSVHQDAGLGLRAVCMPYFGGASLAKVQEKVWDGRGLPVSGKALIEALDNVAGPEPAVRAVQHAVPETENRSWKANLQSAHTARNTLAALTYVQASAWIVCRLAEGLHHSHERNVIHRDIKPSNILISAEAQPLLLDFNVSQALDCELDSATLGGTIAYMAPEQLRAVIKRDPESLKCVTHQSDVYSLGLVLYEMLNGPSPFRETITASVDTRSLESLLEERERPVPSLKATCPLDIPWSLESIVRKCLAPNPAHRYKSAAQMAEDLNRFLQDMPLKFAPELSRSEQVRKWSRRHPKLTTSAIVVLVAMAFIIPGAQLLSETQVDLVRKREQLEEKMALEQAKLFQAKAQRALCLVNTETPVEETFRSGMAACEETLALFAIVTNLDWQDGPYWRRLKASERLRSEENAQELLLVLAWAHVRTLPGKDTAVLTALGLLKKAEAIRNLPASRALMLDRARYLKLLNRNTDSQDALIQANSIPVISAHDHYMLGCAYARYGTHEGYREAIKLLTKAVGLSPGHFWSYFERALCHQELDESLLAASDLGTCIGLWPESSWAYFNRGYVLDRGGLKNEAVSDYTRSIKINPQFISAYFNRGLANLELRNPEAALKDFEQVRELEKSQHVGGHDNIIDAAQAMALEGMRRYEDADRLFEKVLSQNKGGTGRIEQRIAWTYAFAISRRKPEIAGQIFDNILKINPKHPQALYGQGMLSMNRKLLREAVGYFDRALVADPEFIEPMRYRAISLARLGQIEAAADDANTCIAREPINPDSLYSSACVAAISARKLKLESIGESALDLLEKAISCGADPERARDDPDFLALRDNPRFRKLINPPKGRKSPGQTETADRTRE